MISRRGARHGAETERESRSAARLLLNGAVGRVGEAECGRGDTHFVTKTHTQMHKEGEAPAESRCGSSTCSRQS